MHPPRFIHSAGHRTATGPRTATPLTRREALGRVGSASLLALGLWPGALRADNETPPGSFRFLVVNDTHCMSPACGEYLRKVVIQMKAEAAEFCLHAGDLTDQAAPEDFQIVKDVFGRLPGRFCPVIGNHDYASNTDRSAYTEAFPDRLNYSFSHGGWQFVGLDTTEGQRYDRTSIHPETFRWLREHLPRLTPRRPTVIFTHFPLGPGVNYRPLNADALLDLFLDFNLKAVFSGHFHGFTERTARGAVLTTNRCCSRRRDNHDGSKEKGYFLCTAQEGRILRSFVEHRT